MIKLIFTVVFLLSFRQAANAQTGCLLSLKGKYIVDEKCKCLTTKNCVIFPVFKQDEEMLRAQKDRNGADLYSNEEISKLKEATDLFNKIIALKAKGEGKGDEIKALYIKLDKVNYDVRKLMLTRHAEFFTEAKTKYQNNLEYMKKRQKKLQSRINDYLKNGSKPIAEAIKEISSDTNLSKVQEKSEETKTALTAAPVSSPVEKALNKVENEEILKNLKPEKLNREEDDSLFDILSKTYKRKAYPVLLGE